MTRTNGNNALPGANAQRPSKLKAVMHRWHQALIDLPKSLFSGDRHERIESGRRDRSAAAAQLEPQLEPVADTRPERSAPAPPTGHADAQERELVPLPDERSQALAVLCDRLLHELDGAEVNGAEIRFVVHKHEAPSHPRVDPGSAAAGEGELVLELRRLIAWSGGTIADVARALEIRGAELGKDARELLKDEVEALDVDLATLSAYLADPVDWDTEFGCLLAGEVGPLDDHADDEDDEHDG